jgi:hypothetical protein
MTGLFEGFVANITLVGSISSVNPLMSGEVTGVIESFLTDVTLERSFPCMGSFMPDKMCKLAESFVAKITFEGLFPCVGSFMNDNVAGIRKAFVTDVTFVRLEANVGSPVASQVTLLPERLVAELALVGPLPCVHAFVLETGRHRAEPLIANVAVDTLWWLLRVLSNLRILFLLSLRVGYPVVYVLDCRFYFSLGSIIWSLVYIVLVNTVR